MRKIYYSPFYNLSNEYCNRMKSFLSYYGNVLPINKWNFIKIFLLVRRDDYIFLNWVENSIIRKGQFSLLGFIKVFLIFSLFRLSLGKLVFVKHNHYPHDCSKKSIKVSIWAMNVLEKIANKVIIHSIPDLRDNYSYVPHPLYKEVLDSNLINTGTDTYLIFGRILPYKKIENVIEIFPENKKLIIAGACDDITYLTKLEKLVLSKSNIKIMARFLNHEEIKFLASESAGILITHNDDDMIVSGSFFYAMTLKSKVYALETPFFKWAEEQMGSDYISTFKNLNELSKGILCKKKNKKKYSMIDLFGEKAVHNSLCDFFNVSNSSK